MIYQTLKFLFRIAIQQYFRKISLHFTETIPTNRPVLYVANHQSAFMDAVVISTQLETPLHFVARGESFDTPFKRWLLGLFNMHPIYRKDFTPTLTHKNQQMILQFQQLLLSGKSILIFPEGISKTEPRLREIKTGAARIALGAAAEAIKEEESPLVVPIGLNYSNPHQFRSKLMLHFGAPIDLVKYESTYANNPRKVVGMLTHEIKETLQELTLGIEDEQLEEVVDAATAVFEEELLYGEGSDLATAGKKFTVRKELIKAAHYFKKDFPFRLQHIKAHLKHYKQLLSNYEIEDKWLREDKKPYESILFIFALSRLVGLLPVFIFGCLVHMPAVFLSKVMADKTCKRADFKGSLLLSFGLLYCLLSYAGQMILVGYLSGSMVLAMSYAFLLPVVGILSLRYISWYHKFLVVYKKQSFSEDKDSQIQYLKAQRKQLIDLLHAARIDYLKMRKGAISLLL